MHGQFESAVLARRHVIDEVTGDSSELVELIVARVELGQLTYPADPPAGVRPRHAQARPVGRRHR